MSRQQRRALERERMKQAGPSSPQPASTAAAASVSTGPRTLEGKAVSSKNALSHGMTSSQLVLPWESKADYHHLVTQLFAEHQPDTITEEIMVKEMVENYWRLLRARNHEYRLLERTDEIYNESRRDISILVHWEKSVTLAQRYVTRFERGFHKCLATLRTLQKERRVKEAEAEAEQLESAAEPTGQFVLQNAATLLEPESKHQFVSQKDAQLPEQAQSKAA